MYVPRTVVDVLIEIKRDNLVLIRIGFILWFLSVDTIISTEFIIFLSFLPL